MRNFNAMHNTMNMTRNISPFATAGSTTSTIANTATRSGLLSKIGGSKMTLSGILNGAQKTIGTVNQIVPLYNQVKPLFQNSKVLLNVAKGLKGSGDSNNESRGLFGLKKRRRPVYNVQEQENKVDKQVETKVEVKENIKEEKVKENTPSKPYFV